MPNELMTDFAAVTTDIARAREGFDLQDPFRHVKRDLIREAEATLADATRRARSLLYALEALDEAAHSNGKGGE